MVINSQGDVENETAEEKRRRLERERLVREREEDKTDPSRPSQQDNIKNKIEIGGRTSTQLKRGTALEKQTKNISEVGEVSKEEFEREKRLTGTSNDPALARRAERERQENIQTVTEAGLLQPNEQQLETAEQQVETAEQQVETEQEEPVLLSSLTTLERATLDTNRIATNSQTGEKIVLPEPVGGLSKAGEAFAGAVAGTAAVGAVAPLAESALGFLSNAVTAGNVATAPAKAQAVLKAPAAAKGVSSNLKTAAFTILGFAGLGSAKSITTNLLTSKVKNIETETGKLGEQITKIPETARLGFTLDDKGKVTEFTPEIALQELNEIDDTLTELETNLKTASIGQSVLKLNGKYNSAVAEIEKQKRELQSARAKILDVLVNTPDTLENSRDFWRSLELE